MKKFYFIAIFVSLLALWPFFKSGFFESHDGEWMIIRFSAFHQTLSSGQFPVRFVDRLNNSYGYPVINFLYPLPFYASEIPKVLGVGFVNSIKITFITSTLISTIAMYWALSQYFSRYASLAGSLVYLFIPYRFVDLYVRGSLGESVAFAIAPLVLGAIFKISKGQKIYLPVLAISVGLLITSHNVLAVLFLILLLPISILLIKKNVFSIILSFLTGFLISAFYWVPALYDLQFVKFSHTKISNISEHLSTFERLIIPDWGYGILPKGELGFSPQVGLVSLSIFILAVYLLAKSKRKDKIIIFLISIFVISFFLNLELSMSLWRYIPYIEVIQFPWRLLSLIVLTSSILAAFVIDSVKKKKIVTTIVILGSVLSTIVYTKPSNFVEREEGFYSTNEATTTVQDEYQPVWVNQSIISRANEKIEVQHGEVIDKTISPADYRATILASRDTNVVVNTIYFPGHRVTINSKEIEINFNNPQGLINFQLPKGIHKVIIKYSKTPVHLASEIVSALSLTGTGIYLIFLWKKQNS